MDVSPLAPVTKRVLSGVVVVRSTLRTFASVRGPYSNRAAVFTAPRDAATLKAASGTVAARVGAPPADTEPPPPSLNVVTFPGTVANRAGDVVSPPDALARYTRYNAAPGTGDHVSNGEVVSGCDKPGTDT